MKREMKIGDRPIGKGHPTYIISEIGINHDGSLEKAMKLMRHAAAAGADAVKFQKRNHWHALIPADLWDQPKLTPWGETMPYHEYRKAMEFDLNEWRELFGLARTLNVDCFASVWDRIACTWLVDNFEDEIDCIKIPSAFLTNEPLLHYAATRGKAVILSSGMSTMEEIRQAATRMDSYGTRDWALLHCHSAYPTKNPNEVNLRVIQSFQKKFDVPIGFSSHTTGIIAPVLAVALGADIVEAHITLDRSNIGSDHAASIEPRGFERMVGYIRDTEKMLGDGRKVLWETELNARAKLRGAIEPHTVENGVVHITRDGSDMETQTKL